MPLTLFNKVHQKTHFCTWIWPFRVWATKNAQNSPNTQFMPKNTQIECFLHCSPKYIRKHDFGLKYDHFVFVQRYMQKTHQTFSLCTKTTQIAWFWHCSPKCIRKHVFGLKYGHFVFVEGYMHKSHQTLIYAQKSRKSHVFDIIRKKWIRRHDFGLKFDHFVCVCKDTCIKHRKTCENTLFCTKSTQFAYFWHCSLTCIEKHGLGLKYDHFVCVQWEMQKTHQELSLCTKTRKIHFFDIVRQSA